MQKNQRRRVLCATTLLVAVIACRDSEIAAPAQPGSPMYSVGIQDGTIPALQDLIRDVPAVAGRRESIPTNLSDSELIAAVQAAGGLVHIGFKPATAPRTKDTGIFPAVTREQFGQARLGVMSLGGRTIRSYRGMASVVAEIRPELAPTIRELPVVNYLVPASRFSLTQGSQETSWGATRIRAPQAWSPLGFRGDGANIVIIDSGSDNYHRTQIDGDGPTNSFENCYYTSPTFTTCNDDLGHGSHVAGIAAAKDNTVGYIGIAHRPTTTSTIKVCDVLGCESPDLTAALDWVATNARLRQVVNMSLGDCANNTGVYEAIVRAKAAGALLIASAGNTNPAVCLPQVQFPARYQEVIAVSGTLEDDSFAYSSFSCPETGSVGGSRYGPEVELSAPFYARSMGLNGSYGNRCGTSMAAPVVTGVAALIWNKWPGWSADQVRTRLQGARVDLGESGRDPYYGYGRLDALFAVSDEALLSELYLSGPTSVYEYDSATWTVAAAGGFAPITYTWEIVVNGLAVHTATGPSVTYTNRGYWTDGPSFWVGVTARDATGATRNTSQSVAITMCSDPTEPC